MNKKKKDVLVKLLGAIGVIILLGGIFLKLYDFTTGLFIAIVIWILTGVLAKYWNVKK
jgi:hypothetical protein